MNPLDGKWQQPEGQGYPGLFFIFKEDGTFESEYPEMGIKSSGKYAVKDDLIFMEQNQHTLGLVGKFEGRFALEGDQLKMVFGNPGEPAPQDLSKARLYLKI